MTRGPANFPSRSKKSKPPQRDSVPTLPSKASCKEGFLAKWKPSKERESGEVSGKTSALLGEVCQDAEDGLDGFISVKKGKIPSKLSLPTQPAKKEPKKEEKKKKKFGGRKSATGFRDEIEEGLDFYKFPEPAQYPLVKDKEEKEIPVGYMYDLKPNGLTKGDKHFHLCESIKTLYEEEFNGEFEQMVSNRGGWRLSAMTDAGGLIAFCMYRLKGDCLLVADIAVVKEKRRLGHGKRMIRNVMKWAKKTNCGYVALYALPKVVKFYQTLGFKISDTKENIMVYRQTLMDLGRNAEVAKEKLVVGQLYMTLPFKRKGKY